MEDNGLGIPTQVPLSNESFIGESASVRRLAEVVAFLGRYYIPLVVVLGLVGNTLSLVVFLLTYLNRLSLSVYLAALAVSDNGFLFALAISWMDYAGLSLVHTNGWCQMVVYVSYVTSFLSMWFTVSFTVERYIAICHALHRPEMCTTQRARWVVCSLAVFGLSAYAVSLRTSGVEQIQHPNISICVPFHDFVNIHHVLVYTDTLITLLIPFTVLLILNSVITYRISYFYGKKRQMSALKVRFVGQRGESQAKVCLGSRAQVQMTKMLLVISTVFLAGNCPSYIIRLRLFIDYFTKSSITTSRYDAAVQQLSQFIFYLSFSINFFLYNICSKKFRDALSRMFWKMKYKVSNFLQRSYRILRGSSSPDTVYNVEVPLRPAVLERNAYE